MPIATPEVYAQMLDTAKQRGFAYPSINVTSSQTLNAALRGFADADSDGIIQMSTGGAEYLSGSVKDMVTGAVALAEFAHVVAARMYRPRSPSPSVSATARASSGVLYSFSLISPTMPSSSPPTTPISISMIVCAAAQSASNSAAICRFSASGTAEPSHMCDWNSGS